MGFDILGFFTGIKTRVYLWGAAILGVVVLLVNIYLRGRKSGESHLRESIYERNEKIQDAWKEIDSRPADVDASLSRLRQRSAKAGYRPKT